MRKKYLVYGVVTFFILIISTGNTFAMSEGDSRRTGIDLQLLEYGKKLERISKKEELRKEKERKRRLQEQNYFQQLGTQLGEYLKEKLRG